MFTYILSFPNQLSNEDVARDPPRSIWYVRCAADEGGRGAGQAVAPRVQRFRAHAAATAEAQTGRMGLRGSARLGEEPLVGAGVDGKNLRHSRMGCGGAVCVNACPRAVARDVGVRATPGWR